MDIFKKNKIKKEVEFPKVAKVPVIMQLEALECGAASLAMVLAYYNKWIPLEKVRADCGVSRDGSNAKNVMKAARYYGLEAKGYRMEPKVLRESGSFPCIVHWEFNHFIVVDGFKKGKVYINDPAKGTVVMDEKVFDEGFTGIVLMFSPSEDFEPSGSQRSVLSFVKKRLVGTKTAVIFVLLTTILSSLFGIITPGFSRVFMDKLLTGQEPGWVNPFFILMLSLTILQLLVAWIQAIYNLRISGRFDVVGNSTYMWKVLHLPMNFFSQRMAGDIQQRKTTNAGIAESLVNTFTPLVINTGMMFFYLVIILRQSVLLTMVGILSVLVNSFLGKYISKKRVNISRNMMRDSGKLYGTTIAGIEMMETIKSSGAEDGFFARWSGYQAKVNNAKVEYTKLNSYVGLLPTLVSAVSSNIVLLLGVFLIMAGRFTTGSLMAFQGFLSSFLSPASTLISTGQEFIEMRTEMERIEDVMEYPSDITDDLEGGSEDTEYSKLRGRVELKNVTFGYSPLGDPLIKDFTMTIEPGMKVAFVGTTGSGKSTLSKLISGLYKPWSGEILFDGQPLETINRDVFTSSLAVVDQDIILFEDSIEDNIRMWDNSIEDFEVILAARDAAIHADIMEKNGGYKHRIAEGGSDFSGGQKQRLEIARVLAQDPTIIIMDEATSALDAKTEYEVVKSIKDRGITCIVVAHRLSTIRDCDEIIVLDHGNVVERGKHSELYAKNGYYTSLVASE